MGVGKIGLVLGLIFTLFSCSEVEQAKIQPGEIFKDIDGNPINAHGGGILLHEGTYYWYGEMKQGETWRVPYLDWECYRCNAGGVNCYSSQDLVNWKHEGVALAAAKIDLTHDLHTSKVIERPKVIYNDKTQKFVMWMHIDSEDYQCARAGVAISDTPQGPFTYLKSMRPNASMSRDMTLFKDNDGKAYHFYSSENNKTMHVSLLNDEYTAPSGKYKRILEMESREAPAVWKHKGQYYMISSGCTGWSPNPAQISICDSVMGDWKTVYDPCEGLDADKTFTSQSTYVLPNPNRKGEYIYMGDRWNKTNLEDSRYVWLPMTFEKGKAKITWHKEWNVN
ncbi:glycoside hydrolase family 43 protein [Labilibaculum antarcticum]|uniref:Glycosyl hydrolase family 43 n=1 Tax=Labilibaculum antarcticum TaxID=1717717 RepID=A0A1Y1CR24_9BACT|nr:glycoside hydrolase family 43 protein [Labilibaculum antarcticum]BAX82392.1 glycosyl hydrolase family 43 [Labilibaculum antarcticum]